MLNRHFSRSSPPPSSAARLMGRLLSLLAQLLRQEPEALLFYGADLRWQAVGRVQPRSGGGNILSLAVSYCGNPQDLYLDNPRQELRIWAALTDGEPASSDASPVYFWQSTQQVLPLTGKRTYTLPLPDWQPARHQCLLLAMGYGRRQFSLTLRPYFGREGRKMVSLKQAGREAVSIEGPAGRQ